MNWTQEKPITWGFYWFRQYAEDGDPRIVEIHPEFIPHPDNTGYSDDTDLIRETGRWLVAFYSEEPIYLDETHGAWYYGPLDKPPM